MNRGRTRIASRYWTRTWSGQSMTSSSYTDGCHTRYCMRTGLTCWETFQCRFCAYSALNSSMGRCERWSHSQLAPWADRYFTRCFHATHLSVLRVAFTPCLVFVSSNCKTGTSHLHALYVTMALFFSPSYSLLSSFLIRAFTFGNVKQTRHGGVTWVAVSPVLPLVFLLSTSIKKHGATSITRRDSHGCRSTLTTAGLVRPKYFSTIFWQNFSILRKPGIGRQFETAFVLVDGYGVSCVNNRTRVAHWSAK